MWGSSLHGNQIFQDKTRLREVEVETKIAKKTSWLFPLCLSLPATQYGGSCHSTNTKAKCSHPEATHVLSADILDVGIGLDHVFVELIIYSLFFPHESLNILHRLSNPSMRRSTGHKVLTARYWILDMNSTMLLVKKKPKLRGYFPQKSRLWVELKQYVLPGPIQSSWQQFLRS